MKKVKKICTLVVITMFTILAGSTCISTSALVNTNAKTDTINIATKEVIKVEKITSVANFNTVSAQNQLNASLKQVNKLKSFGNAYRDRYNKLIARLNVVKAKIQKKVLADKATASKKAADKAAADKIVAEKAVADKAIADKIEAERAAAEKMEADKTALINDNPSNPFSVKIGDYVQFGTYLNAPILWRVINLDSEGSPLIFAESALCLKPFDVAESGKESQTGANPYSDIEARQQYGSNKWENSDIRQWLNSGDSVVKYITQAPTNEAVYQGNNDYADEAGFLNHFSEAERNAIKPVTRKSLLAEVDSGEKTGGTEGHQLDVDIKTCVTNYDKVYYKNLTDKVFLLGVKELHDYVYDRGFEYKRKPTKEAVADSEYKASSINEAVYCTYFLETPADFDAISVRYVMYSGDIDKGSDDYNIAGIVPALTLTSRVYTSGKGTIAEPYVMNGN
jgi:hypothetical protein